MYAVICRNGDCHPRMSVTRRWALAAAKLWWLDRTLLACGPHRVVSV